MKKKCCHVRMLSPNKSCRKDNLDRVIYMQQHNYPLINQHLRESKKIQAAIHINMYMLPLKDHEANPQSCLNQAVVQHNVRLNGKPLREKPRNIVQQLLERPTKQCQKFLADYALTQQHFVAASMEQSVSNRLPSSKQMEDRPSGKKSFKMTQV